MVLPLPGTAVSFVSISFLCSEGPGFLPAWGTQVVGLINMQAAQRQVWSPQVTAGQNVGCTPFAGRVLPTVAGSGGLV